MRFAGLGKSLCSTGRAETPNDNYHDYDDGNKYVDDDYDDDWNVKYLDQSQVVPGIMQNRLL